MSIMYFLYFYIIFISYNFFSVNVTFRVGCNVFSSTVFYMFKKFVYKIISLFICIKLV